MDKHWSAVRKQHNSASFVSQLYWTMNHLRTIYFGKKNVFLSFILSEVINQNFNMMLVERVKSVDL